MKKITEVMGEVSKGMFSAYENDRECSAMWIMYLCGFINEKGIEFKAKMESDRLHIYNMDGTLYKTEEMFW